MPFLSVGARENRELERVRVAPPPQFALACQAIERLDQVLGMKRRPNLEENVHHLLVDREEPVDDARWEDDRLSHPERPPLAGDLDPQSARQHFVPFFLPRLHVLDGRVAARPEVDLEAQKLATCAPSGVAKDHALAGGRVLEHLSRLSHSRILIALAPSLKARAPGLCSPTLPETVRGVRRELRPLLFAYSLMGFAAGFPLFLYSGDTDRFAWTIKPPLTAAFLGAAYWGSLVLNLLASRERTWARVRIALVPGLVFTTLLLVATLLHLDRFHLGNSSDAIGRAVAWTWLVVYIAIPPLTLAAVAAQLRASGMDPPRTAPLPGWMRIAFAAQGLVLIVLGVVLFAAPSTADSLWPWTLTPLTARAAGAWLCGAGLTAAFAAFENDLRRIRAMLAGYAALGALEGIAIARYPHTPDWSGPAPWLYVSFLATMLILALSALLRRRSVL